MKYLLPFCLVFLFSCKDDPQKTASVPTDTADQLPEGFAEFYRQFHADSLYQMEHIVFPLEGLPDKADSLTLAKNTFRWQAEDWKMMGPIDYQMSEFTRELVPLNDRIVMERIIHKGGGFGMVRRFAIVGDEWHLIYYAGLNRLK